MIKSIGMFLLWVALAGFAIANDDHAWQQTNHVVYGEHSQTDKTVTSAPEIDPAAAASGLTLLAGCLAIIRGRRGRK